MAGTGEGCGSWMRSQRVRTQNLAERANEVGNSGKGAELRQGQVLRMGGGVCRIVRMQQELDKQALCQLGGWHKLCPLQGMTLRPVAGELAFPHLPPAGPLPPSHRHLAHTSSIPLAQAVVELRGAAEKWEAQAQLGLAQNERLKDLLEESATWDIGQAADAEGAEEEASAEADAGAAGELGAALAGGAEQRARQLEALCGRLQRELLLEKARSAQLALQVGVWWVGWGGWRGAQPRVVLGGRSWPSGFWSGQGAGVLRQPQTSFWRIDRRARKRLGWHNGLWAGPPPRQPLARVPNGWA
jgi:hypothetical protein